MNVSAVERAYRELRKPSQQQRESIPIKAEAPQMVITQDDAHAIIQHKRGATVGELQYILDHPKDFTLTSWQKNEIALQLTMAMAAKAREAQGIKHDPNSRMFYALDVAETPYGLLHNRAAFQQLWKSSAEAIRACRKHQPPRCNCWRNTRDVLWNIGFTHSEKSPEGFASRRIWEALEELDIASRPECGPGLT